MSGQRRFLVWAEVRRCAHELVLPAGTTDQQAEAACREVLDSFIGNGDTGWNETTGGEER